MRSIVRAVKSLIEMFSKLVNMRGELFAAFFDHELHLELRGTLVRLVVLRAHFLVLLRFVGVSRAVSLRR